VALTTETNPQLHLAVRRINDMAQTTGRSMLQAPLFALAQALA
jgi:hypothetical protein